jgi:hypothetical protein
MVDIAVLAGDLAHIAPGDLPELVGPLLDHLGARGDDDHPVDFAHGQQGLGDGARDPGLAGARRGVDQKPAILPFLDQPGQGLVVGFLLPGAELERRHGRSFLAVARPAQGLTVTELRRAAQDERHHVIGVKSRFQGLAAMLAAAGGDPGEHPPLQRRETALHVFTQYSMSWISRTGRLAGGCSTACWLIRRTAVA